MNSETKRYKVIADYPNSEFGKDEILTATEWAGVYRSELNGAEIALPNEYPAIFKELAWYEERTAEEMPEYVKHIPTGRVIMVRWDGVEPYEIPNGDKSIADGKHYFIRYAPWVFDLIQPYDSTVSHFTPATKDEYTEFIKNM